MKMQSWKMTVPGEPLTLQTSDLPVPNAGEALLKVLACGLCHTDLGFFYDGVPTRQALPLTLGHEIVGEVIGVGAGGEQWQGRTVIVPAVMPCGECDVCRAGRGSICPKQIFPGNDIDGGFASHVVVPTKGLCPVPEGVEDPVPLSVIADAVTTPYQSIRRGDVSEGDLVVFVGAGGVGAFGVQIARALGATVVAIDIDDARLMACAEHGASLTINAGEHDNRAIKKTVRGFAKENNLPLVCWKIFETSGTPAGQQTAFGLVGHGSYLGIVGYTAQKVEIGLSRLMAFDAKAEGNWGCLPELYPEVLEMVLDGKVAIEPFVERRPLSEINAVFEAVHARELTSRVVFIPDND